MHMRRTLSIAVWITLLSVGVTPPEAVADHDRAPGRDRALLTELRANGAQVARHAATGQLRSVAGRAGDPAATSEDLGRPSTARAAARRFMSRYGSLFGIADASRDLHLTRERATEGGRTALRYQQLHRGVPVLGGDLMVHVGPGRDVLSASGEASPALRVDVEPVVSAAAASRTAAKRTARKHGVASGTLRASRVQLWIYDPALMGGRALPYARLVWRIEVTNAMGDLSDLVLVDARTGGVALAFSQIAYGTPTTDASQLVCDQQGQRENVNDKLPCTAATDINAYPPPQTAPVDDNRAYDYAEDTYDFYRLRFDRDSIDDAGMQIVSTVRYCPSTGQGECPYQNAFWNGSQMAYGTGFANADDVVGHELTHGVTESDSDLFYYYQSGAVNEALSDIFGEFVDQAFDHGPDDDDSAGAKWLIGEDTGAIRDMEDPTSFAAPDRMRSEYYWPDPFESDNGGVHTNSGVANKAAYLITDGGTFNGRTVSGLGIDKAAYLFYVVNRDHLGTASDYADLATALRTACGLAVGVVTPNDGSGNPSGSGAFTLSDCDEVDDALAATEMNQQPRVLEAAATEAPVCSNGSPATALVDEFAESHPGWVAGGTPGRWLDDSFYASSDPWHLYGSDRGGTGDAWIRMQSAVTIPSNAFLRLEHAYGFEDGSEDDPGSTKRYDGGLVEYSLNGSGGPWIDAGPLFTHNGYNGKLASGSGNVLAGRKAFTAESAGYISSRLSLAALAGRGAMFRFRIATDAGGVDFGWVIDDVHIYTCPTDADGPPEVLPPEVRLGRNVSIKKSGTNVVPVYVEISVIDTSGTSATALQQAVGGGSFADVNVSPLGSTSVKVLVAPSATTTRTFRAAAVDEAGNGSLNTFGPAGGPYRVRAIQDAGGSVTYSGSWSTQSATKFFGGRVRFADLATESASIMQTGIGYGLVTTMGIDRGAVRVVIKESGLTVVDEIVDLFWAFERPRMIAFSWDFATSVPRTMEIKPVDIGFGVGRVDLDAFLVVGP
ncbi:MAG: M4 family metallopeptidase [Chloroflexi bacterium]|nr:M4 family metallopeptidase [Chloroflexota bacterium]